MGLQLNRLSRDGVIFVLMYMNATVDNPSMLAGLPSSLLPSSLLLIATVTTIMINPPQTLEMKRVQKLFGTTNRWFSFSIFGKSMLYLIILGPTTNLRIFHLKSVYFCWLD
jgi:hypothetical protein